MGGGGSQAKDHPYEYLAASAISAAINYPLWRSAAIGQSGYKVSLHVSSSSSSTLLSTIPIPRGLTPYVYAFAPPYKGALATIGGMTWARAAIFWGADRGKDVLQQSFPQSHPSIITLSPPLIVSIFVQIINQPIVRATITIQNPESPLPNIRSALRHIYTQHGLQGLWHGTSAGILKTVPKYCTAILVKDYMECTLPQVDRNSPTYKTDQLWRSALKSAIAGIAGAALTNPLDVIRNEMFKTNKPLLETVKLLYQELKWRFLLRGMGTNLVAVSIPLASTIFFTDALIQLTTTKMTISS